MGLILYIRTLYYGQEDDNDKEEEGNVKDDPIDLVFITCRVFNFIANAPSGTYPDVHVEHVALEERDAVTSGWNAHASGSSPHPYSGAGGVFAFSATHLCFSTCNCDVDWAPSHSTSVTHCKK